VEQVRDTDHDGRVVIVAAQTRAAFLCSLVAGTTAVNAVIFADRTLGDVVRGMTIDAASVIRLAAMSAFLTGTILVSSLLAQRSGQPPREAP
jgi:hypothetical protein